MPGVGYEGLRAHDPGSARESEAAANGRVGPRTLLPSRYSSAVPSGPLGSLVREPALSPKATMTAATKGEKPTPLDIVYLLGAHRSGSTVVGAMLSAAPGVFFLGEAYRFPTPLFWPPERLKTLSWPRDPTVGCSCGVPGAECPFWSEVRKELERRAPLLDRLADGQRRYERWSSLPARARAAVRHDPAWEAHLDRHMEFLRLVADRAGATMLVDGSFSAVRGSLYRSADLQGGRAYFVHMVRDGRSFLDSELHSTGRDPETPTGWLRTLPVILGRWVVYNLAGLWLWIRDPRSYIRIRYEDLMLDPVEALGRIGRFLGIDYSRTAAELAAGNPVEMRHIYAGNRVRLLGRVSLRRELAGPPRLAPAVSAAFWTVAGWLALLFGYRPGRRRSGPRP